MKLNSYVNVNNIIIYIYKLKIILFNFMDKIYSKIKKNMLLLYVLKFFFIRIKLIYILLTRVYNKK